jgi:hypothetical protein
MGNALRWLAFAPAAIFMGFVMLVLVNNVADWLSSDFPVVAQRWPLAYVLADLVWPMIFVLVAAFVAPAGRLAVAAIFALLACGLALAAGGSLSLYWVEQTPESFHKIGLAATVIGSLAGVLLVLLITRSQARAPRTAQA